MVGQWASVDTAHSECMRPVCSCEGELELEDSYISGYSGLTAYSVLFVQIFVGCVSSISSSINVELSLFCSLFSTRGVDGQRSVWRREDKNPRVVYFLSLNLSLSFSVSLTKICSIS